MAFRAVRTFITRASQSARQSVNAGASASSWLNKRTAMLVAGASATAAGAFMFMNPLLAEQSSGETTSNDPMWRSKHNQKIDHHRNSGHEGHEIILFTGNANKPLAAEIAEHLGTKLGQITVGRFADGEVQVQIHDNIRGKDVYIIQPTCPPVNDSLMELLLMVSTMRRASARRITAVIPYYGYARQDRKVNSRVPISAADTARLLETMGVDRVIAVDLHCGQIQGFFGPRVPVDNLEASVVGLQYFKEKQKLVNPVVVSPDAGGVYRARSFQEGLRKYGGDLKETSLAMIIKQRAKASVIDRMDLVGNVEGCDVIIVDDMIDTAGTLVQAAEELKKKGAKRVFAFATHGLFSGPAIERINNSVLEEVVVTNSVPRPKGSTNKIVHLPVSIVLAEGIRRVHQKESVSALFQK